MDLKFVLCVHSCSDKKGSFSLKSYNDPGDINSNPQNSKDINVKIIFNSPPNTKSYIERLTTTDVLNIMDKPGFETPQQDLEWDQNMYKKLKEYNSEAFPTGKLAGRDYFDNQSDSFFCPNYRLMFDQRQQTSCGFGLWNLKHTPENDIPLDNDLWCPGSRTTLKEFIDYYTIPDKGVFPKSITCYIFTCRGILEQTIYTERSAESNGNQKTQPYNYLEETELLGSEKETAKIICQTDGNPVCKKMKGGSIRKRKTKRNKKRGRSKKFKKLKKN